MIPTTYLIRATGNHDPIHVDLSIEQAAALLDLDAKWLAKQIRKDGRHVMSDEIGGLIVEPEDARVAAFDRQLVGQGG